VDKLNQHPAREFLDNNRNLDEITWDQEILDTLNMVPVSSFRDFTQLLSFLMILNEHKSRIEKYYAVVLSNIDRENYFEQVNVHADKVGVRHRDLSEYPYSGLPEPNYRRNSRLRDQQAA
jgi:hypothetical protein